MLMRNDSCLVEQNNTAVTTSTADSENRHANGAQLARLAAQHLIERGVQNFAFCGRPGGNNPVHLQRGECFKRAIERSGHGCHVYAPETSPHLLSDWEREQDLLADWIRQLPKP